MLSVPVAVLQLYARLLVKTMVGALPQAFAGVGQVLLENAAESQGDWIGNDSQVLWARGVYTSLTTTVCGSSQMYLSVNVVGERCGDGEPRLQWPRQVAPDFRCNCPCKRFAWRDLWKDDEKQLGLLLAIRSRTLLTDFYNSKIRVKIFNLQL